MATGTSDQGEGELSKNGSGILAAGESASMSLNAQLKAAFDKAATTQKQDAKESGEEEEKDVARVPTTSVRDVLESCGLTPSETDLNDALGTVSTEGVDSLTLMELRAVAGMVSGTGTGTSGRSPGTKKTKDIVAQKSYLMNGMLTEDQAILDFLVALDQHRKKCEREGKYIEARTTARRLQELKLHEEEKRKREMKQRQQTELSEAEQGYVQELESHAKIWEEREKAFEEGFSKQLAALEQNHAKVLEGFRQECGNRAPRRPQYSKQLLNQRRVQDYLGRQAKHLEAENVKRMTDRMEDAEMCATLASYDAEVNLKEQQLRLKLQQEVDATMQRAARGRDEMARSKEQDLERRTQRFKNTTKELQSIQRLESIQLEWFLGQQTLAGKRQVPVASSTAKK